MTTIIKAPDSEPYTTFTSFRVFLSGSIDFDKAEKWQDRFEKALQGASDGLIILNPRRDDWDDSWNQSIDDPKFNEQVSWELAGLEKSDLIAMYFDPNTKSPITLLELGLFARSQKIVLYCPDGFWRKGNVDMICDKYNVISVNSFEALISTITRKIPENLW